MTMAVAAMIDPLLASQAERLAALRSPAQKKRQKPAHSAKIFTAGLSTTAMFGLVAAMGWPSGSGVVQGAAPVEAAVTPVALAIPALAIPALAIPAPVTAAQTAPVVVPAPAVVAAPATTQPAPVPTAAAPIVIPVAVPVAQPAAQRPVARAASNTTTKSSG
jgi:hypothetical protein